MIIKEFNTTNYIFMDKKVNVRHYYEELLRIKFNKKQNSVDPVQEIKSKLKQLKK